MTSVTLRRIAPLILPILLGACVTVPPPQTRPVVAAKARQAIRVELARVCPAPLAPPTLRWLAGRIEDDPAQAFAPAGDIDRLDRETRACRGQ